MKIRELKEQDDTNMEKRRNRKIKLTMMKEEKRE